MSPKRADDVSQLFARHASALVLYARQWCQSPEDAVQEAFQDLLQQERPKNPTAWLYTVTKRRALNQSRAKIRRERHHQQAATSQPWFVPASEQTSELPHSTDQLQVSLGRLSDDMREVLILRVWGNLGFKEIAQCLGISMATAHRKYQKALLELKQHLESNALRGDARQAVSKQSKRNSFDALRLGGQSL